MNVSEFVLRAIVRGADGATLLEDWNRIGLNVERASDPILLMCLVAITLLLGVLAV